MDHFTRDDLRQLAQSSQSPSVSVFMPTQHVESAFAQNPIRLKNLVKEARRQFTEQGLQDGEIEVVLAPLQNLVENSSYWMQSGDGFAAFISPGETYFYRLPLSFEELVVTGQRYHLKPLFPLFASNNRFYVLALSQNMVRLFQGTHFSINQVKATEIPTSLVEALFYDDPERSLQHHTANVAGGRHDAIYHGQGSPSDDVRARPQDMLRRFFREIDTGVMDILRDERAPLLLAGVEYYLPIYREANQYPYLVNDQIIAGNPDNLSLVNLHQRAWEMIEPLFLEKQKESSQSFRRHYHTDGLASNDLKEIVPASVFSRVDTLFVLIGKHQWGRYNADENLVYLHDSFQPGDEDLLDLAAVQTYLNGGVVHALREENMPVESMLAATFRFPASVEAVEAGQE